VILNSVILILIYPASFFCAVEPEAYKWGRTHGLKTMPTAFLGEVEKRGRLWYFMKFGLMVALLSLWIAFRAIPVKEIVSGLDSRLLMTILEVAAILVLTRVAFQNLFPRVKQHFAIHPMQRGGLALWILILLIGGIIEEVWRALSLISLQKLAVPELLGLFILAIASLAAQASGIPARMAAIQEEASWQLITGVVLGKLFLVYGTFLVPAPPRAEAIAPLRAS